MDKKTVWISGAANGIGKATAILFANKGYYVGIADINEQGLVKLQNELGVENSHYMVCDTSDSDSTKKAIESFAEKTGGKLDVLIVNAGILAVKHFDEVPLEKYKKIIDINAYGYVNQVYNALPTLKKTNGSHIILISSSSCIWGIPLYSVYSATKAFVKSLSEALEIELKRDGITINTVLPHMVKTAMEETQVQGGRKAEEFYFTAENTANVIWKAANKRKKLHWVMGREIKFFFFLKRIFSVSMMQKMMKKFSYDSFVK